MAKTFTSATLLAVFFFSSFSAFAKIWRVNNNAGVAADFTTLQAAHNGAADGDTLHIEGSATSYGGATFSKKLVVLGTGYFLDENPGSQATLHNSVVGHITLHAGAAGTVIMGLDFRGNGVTVQAHDIIIRRNKFSSPGGSAPDWNVGTVSLHTLHNNGSIPVNNVVIAQNYGLRIDINYASTGILITNNFITYYAYTGENTTGQALVMPTSAIAIIQNNIFRRGRVTVHNSTVMNNIMYVGSFEGTGNLVANNMGHSTQFGTANGNQENIDMNAVFIGSGTGNSSDGQWKLKAGSPAIGAGYGSTSQKPVDAGMYSGGSPYVLAGLPPMPAIYHFENKPVGSDTDPITVTIKVKSVN